MTGDADELKYPWKRDALIAHLEDVLSSYARQSAYGGIWASIEFFLNEEEFQRAQGSVGISIYVDEIEVVSDFAVSLSRLADSLVNIYDTDEAVNHRDWPKVTSLAQQALSVLWAKQAV
ncbi:hypothetical protein [Asticcacaulis sp.]|uniref:hypothetical protein n=1 Tax=Asticcacaulis sp. TaxID=1872648 RepID=UPI00391A60DD